MQFVPVASSVRRYSIDERHTRANGLTWLILSGTLHHNCSDLAFTSRHALLMMAFTKLCVIHNLSWSARGISLLLHHSEGHACFDNSSILPSVPCQMIVIPQSWQRCMWPAVCPNWVLHDALKISEKTRHPVTSRTLSRLHYTIILQMGKSKVYGFQS